MDLVEFLRRMIDDDERLARNAGDETAAAGVTWISFTDDIAHRAIIEAEAMCDHLARHDPARVLREVEAKRGILDLHHEDGGGCAGCGFGNDEQRMNTVDECPTLRLLALPFADAPGYRPEWKPE